MKKRQNRIQRAARLVLLFLVLAVMLRWFEQRQVYHPSRELETSGTDLGRPFEDVWFKTSDGVGLNGWFFPADTASPRVRRVILICHGNGGNISHRLALYEALLGTGVNVFAFDYRGYGRSHGRPGEEGTYLDAQAAHRWLQEKGFAGKDIVAFGESLGGAVATELGRREALGGLVLQSTFTSTADIGAELFPWLPVRWISTIKYDTCRKLPLLKIPVLVMHSRSDELISFHHAEKNFAAANEPKLFWELKGEHNDPLQDRTRFVQGMEKFLRLVEGANAPKPPATPDGI